MRTKNYEKSYNKIIKDLYKYRELDFKFDSGRILGSMCTQPHPISKQVYINFIDTNIGDPDLFPGTKKIESLFIRFILDLLNSPKTAIGQIVSGGTEGNITAMWLAKQLTGKKEIIIPENAHFSFQKISSLMDMKLIKIPLNNHYCINVSKIKNKINKNTAAILGIAGSTELGTIDPIPEISEICLNENIFLHIDAAFGGFIIPFLKELNFDIPDFDFTLKGVSTISLDAHKMGYSAIPLGIIVIKDKNWLEKISVESHCTGSNIQAGILGTRSGGPVAAGYAVARYLGNKGYKNVVEKCMNVTKYTEKRIKNIGLKLVTKPTMNVIGVKIKNLSEVTEKLSEYGWKVNKVKRISCIRIVIMPQISKKIIDEFIPILKKVCIEVGEL
jgi:tyrosine decarboxylase/aspartate 1-decarboxylase